MSKLAAISIFGVLWVALACLIALAWVHEQGPLDSMPPAVQDEPRTEPVPVYRRAPVVIVPILIGEGEE